MSRDGEATTVQAPVVEVTLFEDRARVVRSGRMKLGSGAARVRIDGVAPVLADATLTADVGSEGNVRIVDCRVVRRVVARPPGEEPPSDGIEILERERDALDRQIEERASAVDALEGRGTALAGLLELELREIGEDAAWGRQEASTWSERFASLRAQRAEVASGLLGAKQQLQQTREERHRLVQRLAALQNPSRREWAGIEVDLVADQQGEADLRLEYVVPGACWRPHHTARLIGGDDPKVEFRTDGCVWQRTGEDWEGVRLLFSTERSSLGTDPPRLTSDVLAVQPKPQDVVVETREEEITTTGLGAKTTVADRLPGIDDGGRALSLEAVGPSDVPSDGRATRVPLLRFQSPAQVSLVAQPEVTPAILLKTVLSNEAGSPLLAGPVDLIRDGGFSGRTTLLYVAAGEEFALGWGTEPDLRVQRDSEVHQDKQKMMSSWETRQHRTTIRLSNIGSRPRQVTVTERVPVSEIDKVVIVPDEDETTDGARPDQNGFVEWAVRLEGHQRTTLSLKYALKKHQDVQGL